MSAAAAGLARVIREILPGRARRVILLAGSGNNGGDGLYAVADLAREGVEVIIVAVGSHVHEEGLTAALGAGAVLEAQPFEAARIASLARGSVVVDAILGTGAGPNPSLRGDAREVVGAVQIVTRETDAPVVVAVDIPSGINPDDGTVPDPLVLQATVTVTFGGYKAGVLLDPGASYAGEVRLIDIGLGNELASMEPLVRVDDSITPQPE
jgi:hydroxyethylthiazole kinase-like uncharacterized protein yjeF